MLLVVNNVQVNLFAVTIILKAIQDLFDELDSNASGEEREAAELLAIYRPEYFVSGHDHAFPYMCGQSWNQAVDGV
jgi:hypothetical protein